MAAGRTTTDSLTDSLPKAIVASRLVREQDGDMMSLVDRQTLGKGMGLTWHEVSYAKITAQAITRTTELDNPQQLSDTDFPLTPTMIGLHVFLLDEVGERIISHGMAKFGQLSRVHYVPRCVWNIDLRTYRCGVFEDYRQYHGAGTATHSLCVARFPDQGHIRRVLISSRNLRYHQWHDR